MYTIHLRTWIAVEDKRRRTLVLALSEKEGMVPLQDVRHVSPKIAELYAGLTNKTVQRDIEKLIKLDLIIKEKNGIRPHWELLGTYFTPTKAKNRQQGAPK